MIKVDRRLDRISRKDWAGGKRTNLLRLEKELRRKKRETLKGKVQKQRGLSQNINLLSKEQIKNLNSYGNVFNKEFKRSL